MAVKDNCSCVHRKARTPLDKISLDDDGQQQSSADKNCTPAIKQGVLVKQGNRWRKVWNERYVILDQKTLRYYASGAQDGQPRGKLHLGPRTIVCKMDGDKAPRIRGAGLDWKGAHIGHGMPFCFQITTDLNESFLFQAMSENDRSNWIHAIQQCVDSLAVNGVEREVAKGKKRPEEVERSPSKIVLDEDDIVSGNFLSEGLEKQIKSALQTRPDGISKEDSKVQAKSKQTLEQRSEPKTVVDEKVFGLARELESKARNFTLCGIRPGCMSKDGGPTSWFPLCDRNPPTHENSQNSSPEAHPDAFPLSPRSAGERRDEAEATRQYKVGATEAEKKSKAMLSKNVPKPHFTKKSKASNEGRRTDSVQLSAPVMKVLDDNGKRKIAEAIYAFKAEEKDEIDLEIGDKAAIIEEFDDGWCQIQLLGPGAKRAKELDSMMKEGRHEEIAGWRKKGIVPRSYLKDIDPEMPNEPHGGHENECMQHLSTSALSENKTEEHVSSSSGAESPKEDQLHAETKAKVMNGIAAKSKAEEGKNSVMQSVQDDEKKSGCCVGCFAYKRPKRVF